MWDLQEVYANMQQKELIAIVAGVILAQWDPQKGQGVDVLERNGWLIEQAVKLARATVTQALT